jgi:hypothetical protein
MAAEAPPPGVGCLDERTSQKFWTVEVASEDELSAEDDMVLVWTKIELWIRFEENVPRGRKDDFVANLRSWEEDTVE